MQALAPRVKEIQDRYKRSGGEADAMNVEVSNLYKQAGVNPLAGCLPTLATIPVFIGLYRCIFTPLLVYFVLLGQLPTAAGIQPCQLLLAFGVGSSWHEGITVGTGKLDF